MHFDQYPLVHFRGDCTRATRQIKWHAARGGLANRQRSQRNLEVRHVVIPRSPLVRVVITSIEVYIPEEILIHESKATLKSRRKICSMNILRSDAHPRLLLASPHRYEVGGGVERKSKWVIWIGYIVCGGSAETVRSGADCK